MTYCGDSCGESIALKIATPFLERFIQNDNAGRLKTILAIPKRICISPIHTTVIEYNWISVEIQIVRSSSWDCQATGLQLTGRKEK